LLIDTRTATTLHERLEDTDMATMDRTRLELQAGKSGAYGGSGDRMPLRAWEFDLGPGRLPSNSSLIAPLGRTSSMGGPSRVFQGEPEMNRRR
jgi:hypothetical protein